MKNATNFVSVENNIAEIKSILLFFDTLADDLLIAHDNLTMFCNALILMAFHLTLSVMLFSTMK